jgi:acyl-CoA oxidase
MTLDVPALTAILDGEYAEVRELVRRNLAEHADVLVDAEEMSIPQFRQRVLDVVLMMAETGQTGFGFPKEYGGGGDLGASVAAFETLGFGDLSVLVKVGVQFGLFGGAILHLGTKPHHEAYLDDLIHGRLLGAFAMTETGHGSNVQALGTIATYDPDAAEFVVETPDDSARKDYTGNAGMHARMAVVFAQLVVDGEGRGVHALVVPLRDEAGDPLLGVRLEDCGRKIGLNGVDNGRIWFDRVRVPREALLDRYAVVTEDGRYFSEIENPDKRFFTMLGTLVQGRVCVGGAAINAAKVAMTIAVKYGLVRRQFGAPGSDREELLLDYGQHQRRLFPLLARTYALHFAQERLAADLHAVFSTDDTSEHDRRALESRAAGIKALGTWHASRTIQECREACGGAGYMSVNRFEALRNDTDVFTTFEGDNTVLLQLVAKGLLTDYASEFGELDQIGMVRFVASTALETVLERTNVRLLLERLRDVMPRAGGDAPAEDRGLLDPAYQLEMLAGREEHVLASVARRLKRGMDAGADPVEVFSLCQDHVIAAAWAHVERVVLEAFVDKLATVPDGPEQEALNALCDLFALSCIEADRGWFLEHGRLSTARSKAITSTVNELGRRLRPIAGELVDAFGVPPELLRAPMLHG